MYKVSGTIPSRRLSSQEDMDKRIIGNMYNNLCFIFLPALILCKILHFVELFLPDREEIVLCFENYWKADFRCPFPRAFVVSSRKVKAISSTIGFFVCNHPC